MTRACACMSACSKDASRVRSIKSYKSSRCACANITLILSQQSYFVAFLHAASTGEKIAPPVLSWLRLCGRCLMGNSFLDMYIGGTVLLLYIWYCMRLFLVAVCVLVCSHVSVSIG